MQNPHMYMFVSLFCVSSPTLPRLIGTKYVTEIIGSSILDFFIMLKGKIN